VNYNDPDAVMALIDRFHIDIDEEMETELIETLPEVMERSNNDLETVDFNDQCYLPVIHPHFKNKFDTYDFIMCDEFQDFNRCNIEYILKCLAPGGRIIAVGDHHQSLYGFRGADPQAIPDAIKRLNATVLPLSICYRCPTSHVLAVKDIVPEIEPSPTAKEGTIGYLKYEQMLEMVKEGDMVLCRTNAPLIKPAFALIKEGRKAIIRGKDIGKELVNFIERFNCDSLSRLDILMQQQTEMEMARYIEKNKEMMAEQVKERYETIVEVARECKTVEELLTKLLTLFSDDNIGVVFSSIHRAKGLESENIFWYRRDLCPHPKAKSDEEKEQEMNAIYVAGTRSLDSLYFVSAEDM
jgi:superfamily I DNA/RNA helicase